MDLAHKDSSLVNGDHLCTLATVSLNLFSFYFFLKVDDILRHDAGVCIMSQCFSVYFRTTTLELQQRKDHQSSSKTVESIFFLLGLLNPYSINSQSHIQHRYATLVLSSFIITRSSVSLCGWLHRLRAETSDPQPNMIPDLKRLIISTQPLLVPNEAYQNCCSSTLSEHHYIVHKCSS